MTTKETLDNLTYERDDFQVKPNIEPEIITLADLPYPVGEVNIGSPYFVKRGDRVRAKEKVGTVLSIAHNFETEFYYPKEDMFDLTEWVPRLFGWDFKNQYLYDILFDDGEKDVLTERNVEKIKNLEAIDF